MSGKVLSATLPATGAAGAMYFGIADATQLALAVAAGLAAWAIVYAVVAKRNKR